MTRSADLWAAQLTEARKLDDADLARHAAVSTGNNHTCVECFTCACGAVRDERARAEWRTRFNRNHGIWEG